MKKLVLIYRLYDPSYGLSGNPRTLAVSVNQDNTLSYVYYGGWQDGGTPFSICNMQLRESLPMGARNFKTVDDLHLKLKSILVTGVGSSQISSFEILNDL